MVIFSNPVFDFEDKQTSQSAAIKKGEIFNHKYMMNENLHMDLS